MAYKKSPKDTASFARVIWSNILRQQYIHGLSDSQLCELLGISGRTLYNYRQDPSNITVKQLQAVIESFGVEPETLLQT